MTDMNISSIFVFFKVDVTVMYGYSEDYAVHKIPVPHEMEMHW